MGLQEMVDVQTSFIDTFWNQKILPALEEYITLKCISRNYDPNWPETLPVAAKLIQDWVVKLNIPGAQVKLATAAGRTPFLLIDLPGTVDKTVLLYGHFDKQPAGPGWTVTDPWIPKVVGDRLYGRGAADDGYAVFAAVAAMEALRNQGSPRCRAVICIESDEESGSQDFPYYLAEFSATIGNPDLLFFLDSGAGTYDRLWLTVSLRGIVNATLSASVLKAGVHSGAASGIVPDPVRILRMLLGRLEDTGTGRILPAALNVEIPKDREEEAKKTAEFLGIAIFEEFPVLPGLKPVTADLTQLYLNGSWRPQLTVVGQDGLPATAIAGNVLQPSVALKLSLRLPPTLKAETAKAAVTHVLTHEPPYGSTIELKVDAAADGWNAAPSPAWLDKALATSSQTRFGNPVQTLQEGVSIGVLKLLADKYPKAPFVVTGVLGPQSNAHGPNESLNIPFVKKLTASIADLVRAAADNG